VDASEVPAGVDRDWGKTTRNAAKYRQRAEKTACRNIFGRARSDISEFPYTTRVAPRLEPLADALVDEFVDASVRDLHDELAARRHHRKDLALHFQRTRAEPVSRPAGHVAFAGHSGDDVRESGNRRQHPHVWRIPPSFLRRSDIRHPRLPTDDAVHAEDSLHPADVQLSRRSMQLRSRAADEVIDSSRCSRRLAAET
jgi:hypothetical protein